MNLPTPTQPQQQGLDLGNLFGKIDLTQIILALLALLVHANAPTPTPAQPGNPPPPQPLPGGLNPPPPTPTPSIADRRPTHRINGGEAKLTGMVDMTVPKVQKRLSDAEVDAICAGTMRAPADVRIETDATPAAEDGYVFGPNDPAWVNDPQPGSVDDPEAQPMRLLGELGAGLDGGLRHEYPNFGCDGWFRASGHGDLRRLRYVGPSYGTDHHAELPLMRGGHQIDVIHVG